MYLLFCAVVVVIVIVQKKELLNDVFIAPTLLRNARAMMISSLIIMPIPESFKHCPAA